MTLDTLPPRRPDRTGDGTDARRPSSGPIRRVGVARERREDSGLPRRSLIVALVLACVTLMVIDRASGGSSPVDPVRDGVGEVISPIQDAASTVLHPIVSIPGALRTNGQLRSRIADLQSQNAALSARLAESGYDANRVAELRQLRAMAGDIGYALVTARVEAVGSAQSFDDTVTIDAGSSSGLHPDMTVVNGSGLVGRIVSVTSHSATVLLISDTDSTVGGRIGDNMKLGMVHGQGRMDSDGSLDLDLLDQTVVPRVGQSVVTWGSQGGTPYVSGVPIGKVVKVYQSLRETSYRAVLQPYVDLTSLDTVGVVVPSGTASADIEADGSLTGNAR
ncbi:MAG: rod shape-determining protein MreC [Nocardioidaceae bacterium]|nr:rod shape-determining protein MreC [Nocardioidaceae bacterium]MCL2612879.1 rod shape-determining protein MreC [Nocardioidaceae bacterium]